MDENLTYEEMVAEERRENIINSFICAMIGAGVMAIIALIV